MLKPQQHIINTHSKAAVFFVVLIGLFFASYGAETATLSYSMPYFADTDLDGVDDIEDLDDDNDGILDIYEDSCIQANTFVDFTTIGNGTLLSNQLEPSFGVTFYSLSGFDGVRRSTHGGFTGNRVVGGTTGGGALNWSGIGVRFTNPTNFVSVMSDPLPTAGGDIHFRVFDANGAMLYEDIRPDGTTFFSYTATDVNIYSFEIFKSQRTVASNAAFGDINYRKFTCNLRDTDGDNVPDYVDLDSDNDGISDVFESGLDAQILDPDGNGVIDGAQFRDLNRNGLADAIETIYGDGMGPNPLNSDGDLLENFIDLDSDNDGIPDTIEAFLTANYTNNDGDVRDNDADGDGVIDLFDTNDTTTRNFGGSFTIPVNTDATWPNSDALPDFIDVNSEGDNFTDFEEGGDLINQNLVTYADPNGAIDNPSTDLEDYIVGNNEAAYRESCGPLLLEVPDITVCSEGYTLPVLAVGTYYTGQGATGVQLSSGERISSTQTIYIYAVLPGAATCISEGSFTVFVNGFETIAILQDSQTVCISESPSVINPVQSSTAQGVLSFQWYSSDDNINYTPIIGATTATYTPEIATTDMWYKREDASRLNNIVCLENTNAHYVQVNAILVQGEITQDQVLCNGEVPASITELVQPIAIGQLSHQWQSSTNGVNFTNITGATAAEYTPAALTATTWYQRMDSATLNAAVCIEQTNTVRIQVNQAIEVPTLETLVLQCQENIPTNGVQISIAANAITGGSSTYVRYAFVWDNNTPNNTSDDVVLQEGDSVSYIENNRETRRILVHVYDDLGCFGSTEITIQGRNPLELTTTVDEELCVLDRNGRITLSIIGGAAPYYTSINSALNTDFVAHKLVYDNLTGGTTYTLYVKDSNNCMAELQVDMLPAVDLSADIAVSYYCDAGGSSIQNTVQIDVAPEVLNDVIFTLDDDVSTSTMQPIFANVAPGAHNVTIAYKNGCIATQNPFIVVDKTPLTLALNSSKVNTISASANGGAPNYEYKFEDQAFGSETEFLIQETGTYRVTVRDSYGCESTQQLHIEFLPVRIPNFFTPNGDGIKEGWRPENLEQYPSVQTAIYDRNGRLLKVLGQYDYWYGLYKDSELPSGDYWYILTIDSQAVVESPIIGNFTLYR